LIAAEKKSHVSRIFNISRDTIGPMVNRRKATGSVKALQGYQRGHSHRIKDWEEFHAFANNTATRPKRKWRNSGLGR
jgi:transposase